MSDMVFTAAAIAISLALIALLWRGDPKRRRVARLRDRGDGARRRRLMLVAALLPGALLAAAGDAAAFFVWLGSCAIGGWLIAQFQPTNLPADHRADRHRDRR